MGKNPLSREMILQEVFETADLLDLLDLLLPGDPYLTKPNQQPIWISMGMTQDPKKQWRYVKFIIYKRPYEFWGYSLKFKLEK